MDLFAALHQGQQDGHGLEGTTRQPELGRHVDIVAHHDAHAPVREGMHQIERPDPEIHRPQDGQAADLVERIADKADGEHAQAHDHRKELHEQVEQQKVGHGRGVIKGYQHGGQQRHVQNLFANTVLHGLPTPGMTDLRDLKVLEQFQHGADGLAAVHVGVAPAGVIAPLHQLHVGSLQAGDDLVHALDGERHVMQAGAVGI